MTNEQIKITHHPATDTAPQHWRSSDGYWSAEGSVWFQHDGMFPITTSQIQANHRAAFFNQILNTEEEPRRAKVGDWVQDAGSPACFRVRFVDHDEGVVWSHEEGDGGTGLKHGHYTIVDPAERLTANGSEITQKDGVWERKWSDGSISRYCVRNGRIIVKLDSSGMFSDGCPAKSATYTHISDDDRDLTDWEVE